MSHQRRHSLPLNSIDSDETDSHEVKDLMPEPLPARHRKVFTHINFKSFVAKTLSDIRDSFVELTFHTVFECQISCY